MALIKRNEKNLLLALVSLRIYSFGQNSINERIDSISAELADSKLSASQTAGDVKDSKLIYHNSNGLMNLEYDIPFNDFTVFGIASITRQFTSACIAILEKQGKLFEAKKTR